MHLAEKKPSMKIFKCDQVRRIDEYTIKNEPVSSVDLMERAAAALCDWMVRNIAATSPVAVFAGPGNNGGDGLALARMLYKKDYQVDVYFPDLSGKTSGDWKINRERLDNETEIQSKVIGNQEQFPSLRKGTVIVDAIFGSGLSRPVEGRVAAIIEKINASGCVVVSIDIPSGLFCEENKENNPEHIIKADYTLSFEFPKLAFMFSENGKYTGTFDVLPIGLHKKVIEDTPTPFTFLEGNQIADILKKRNRFDHKGVFGHGLLIGGSFGKIGAVILGARAALRTGIGLVTCHIPSGGDCVLQSAVPEAMAIHDQSERMVSGIGDTKAFTAVGIGPGLGTSEETQRALFDLLGRYKGRLVIDADAINILSQNKEWMELLPAGTILTPHPGEFRRLTGTASSGYDNLDRQLKFSEKYGCIVVLKGAYTSVTDPEGRVWFNSTGNPGMATAGSGDALTGMILSLLSQDYDPVQASVAAVYIHGLAGDIALSKRGAESLIASDIISFIGDAFNKIRADYRRFN